MTSEEPKRQDRSPRASQTGFKWGWAIATGVVLGCLIGIARVRSFVSADTRYRLSVGLDSFWWLLGGAVATVIAAGLWVVWFRPSRRKLLALLAVLAAVALVVGLLFRVEGTYGDLFPRVVWRWSPSAEQQWTAYQARRELPGDRKAESMPAVSLTPTEDDYPGFLGTARDGAIHEVRLDPDWKSRPPRELWRHPVGLGWGGFAIVGEWAFTQEQRGAEETVVCYGLRSGRERWNHRDAVRFSSSHGDGPRATPTVVDGRVYAMGATGLLTCLDGATGRLIWQQRTLPDPAAQNLIWGMSGSPLVVDDWVIVSPGGGSGRSLLAYRCQDGTTVWSGGDDPAAYASPALVQLAGQRQILSLNGAGLRGHDAAQGTPLWLYPWVTQGSNRVNIAQPQLVTPFGPPAANEGYVLISAGYGMGAALVRVISHDGAWQVEEVWRNKELESKMSNFVVHEHWVYGLDNGILTCLDVRDGRRIWKRGRYGHGQILLVHNLLLIQAERGDVVLVEATPEGVRELGRVPALRDKTWNHPALARNVLLVRNDREAAAFEIPLDGSGLRDESESR